MRVSVIVPMYNVQEYVAACLDSLVHQTLDDMEVLLVDDGCTDNTVAIAQRYVDQYPQKFQMLHKANGGLSDARNFAIDHAKGEYLAFLDSDDTVEPEFYQQMAQVMDQGNQVCVCDIEYWYPDDPDKNTIMKGLCPWNCDSIQKKALLSPMFAWNKMYQASLFQKEGYRYPCNTWYEDTPVTTMIFAKATHIGYWPHVGVHYRQRSGSIMSSEKSPRVKEIFHVLELTRNEFQENHLAEPYQAELEYLHIEHLRLYGMFRFIRSGQGKVLYYETQQVMGQYYPNWKQNKYLTNLSKKNQIFLKYYSPWTAWLFDRRIRKH